MGELNCSSFGRNPLDPFSEISRRHDSCSIDLFLVHTKSAVDGLFLKEHLINKNIFIKFSRAKSNDVKNTYNVS